MAYRAAVFDFDGTLVDSRGAIVAAANRTLAEAGLPERAAAEIVPHIGLPLEEVVRRWSRRSDGVARLCERYRVHFAAVAPGNVPLFEGIREAVVALRAAGMRLGVASSRRREGIEEILAELGLAAEFGCVLGGGCIARGKPHPEMLETALARLGVPAGDAVMVGDTTFDLAMGRAAGAATCAVTWGSHALEVLVAESPTHVVRTPAELREALG